MIFLCHCILHIVITLILLKLYIHDLIQLAQELMVLPFCSRYKCYLPFKTS